MCIVIHRVIWTSFHYNDRNKIFIQFVITITPHRQNFRLVDYGETLFLGDFIKQ